jgi:hypothetical protein
MGMDAPERIWAVPLEVNGAVMVGGWADTIRQCPNGTEYVRADILAQTLATPPALVASPEVQALVAALSGMLAIWEKTYYGGGAQHVRNADIDTHSHVMRAALAPFTGAKP